MDNTKQVFEKLEKLIEMEKLIDEELNKYRKMEMYKKHVKFMMSIKT